MNDTPAKAAGLVSEETVCALVDELRFRYRKESACHTQAQLSDMVGQSLAASQQLNINEKADIFRAVALRVLITPEQRNSPIILGSLIRIITNLKWSSKQRLDFIYKHLVGRTVSSNKPDFGTSFVPRGKTSG
jgi:hypothetical protein